LSYKRLWEVLESSNTLTMLLKFQQHPLDKSDLSLEKGTSSSKSQFDSNKCDFCGKSGHSKFRCIHNKKQMSKGTNVAWPKKIWIPKSHIVSIVDIPGRKKSMFLDLKPIEGGIVSFGGMGKGKITSIGKIGTPSVAFINNAWYVKD